VYCNKLVNNLHVITFYKLHNKIVSRACHARRVERVEPVELDVSSQSSSSCRAVLFDKLDTAKMQGLVERVDTRRAKWNLGLCDHSQTL